MDKGSSRIPGRSQSGIWQLSSFKQTGPFFAFYPADRCQCERHRSGTYAAGTQWKRPYHFICKCYILSNRGPIPLQRARMPGYHMGYQEIPSTPGRSAIHLTNRQQDTNLARKPDGYSGQTNPVALTTDQVYIRHRTLPW